MKSGKEPWMKLLKRKTEAAGNRNSDTEKGRRGSWQDGAPTVSGAACVCAGSPAHASSGGELWHIEGCVRCVLPTQKHALYCLVTYTTQVAERKRKGTHDISGYFWERRVGRVRLGEPAEAPSGVVRFCVSSCVWVFSAVLWTICVDVIPFTVLKLPS